jgi:hypothetical protein
VLGLEPVSVAEHKAGKVAGEGQLALEKLPSVEILVEQEVDIAVLGMTEDHSAGKSPRRRRPLFLYCT